MLCFVFYQDPVTGAVKLPDCVSAGLIRAFVGFIYVAIFQIGTLYVSDQYLFEPSFQKLNLIKKCLLIGVWGRINLYKYVSVWLITEGVCNSRLQFSCWLPSSVTRMCISLFDFRCALLSVWHTMEKTLRVELNGTVARTLNYERSKLLRNSITIFFRLT